MQPKNTPGDDLVVYYDKGAHRAAKEFSWREAHKAKQFFVKKARALKNPRLRKKGIPDEPRS